MRSSRRQPFRANARGLRSRRRWRWFDSTATVARERQTASPRSNEDPPDRQVSAHELGDKHAVLLVQLPPSLERDDARLDYFLARLPDWITVVVEFRHPSWHDDAVYRLLESHGAAYCVVSGAGLPCVLRVTASVAYVRMHVPDHHHLSGGSYPDQDLVWWADRLREWRAGGTDVYVYFNNHGDGNAVRNAATLRALVA